MRRNHIIICFAALLATLPLFIGGCSCGHDLGFHLQSWLDAALQFRNGTFHPHWAFSAAFNAGEPRFVFYPPLSWTLGALLTLAFPASLVPAIYTFLALAAAGLAMHRLARHFTSPDAALLAAALYVANPYMLFNAFERTAFAELLAAAWLPLLFLAALGERPTVRGIALPVALLWLTNAPAAVMGCYIFALIMSVRLLLSLWTTKKSDRLPHVSALSGGLTRGAGTPNLAFDTWALPMRLALTSAAGVALGLGLAAFYLVPAAYERRFVQIAMAIIPNMRFQDNFLFGHTEDAAHNAVLHTASLIAVELLAATIVALIVLFLQSARKNDVPRLAPALGEQPHNFLLATIALLTVLIAFLLTPLSTPLWQHAPELAFLQFSWRLLAILAAVLCLTIALLLRTKPLRSTLIIPVSLTLVAALALPAIHVFRQPCEPDDTPSAIAQLFRTHHGVGPTDEYTPVAADNDVLRSDDPPFWLATDPAAFAPDTIPNPAANGPSTAEPPTPTQTISFPPPSHFTVATTSPRTLVLNLRDYPNWAITETSLSSGSIEHPAHILRDDGLIAIPLPSGESTIDIVWRRSLDESVGLGLTAGALLIYLALLRPPSRIKHWME